MSKIKLPALDTPITVLCDMTRKQYLTVDFVGKELRSRKSYSSLAIVTPHYGAPYVQHETYRIVLEASLVAAQGHKTVIIVTNNLQITALAAVLMNGRAEKRLDAVPFIDPKLVRVWEVWNDNNILLSEEDGMVTSTSFDEAFRPIISDIMRIQRLNAPAPADEDAVVEPSDDEEPPQPRILEKAVVDEGVVANSPKDLIARRIAAIQEARNKESGVPMKQADDCPSCDEA